MGGEAPLEEPFEVPFPFEAPCDVPCEAPISVAISAARMQAGIEIVVHTCCDSTAMAARSTNIGRGFQAASPPIFPIPLHFMASSMPPYPSASAALAARSLEWASADRRQASRRQLRP